ncbi:MAG: heavy-metal-associated domain-containing protein [Ignavibacteriales bacterium]|nr:heavy-metal-associated domain-containing protein [Ignavibacteriales bacterium]
MKTQDLTIEGMDCGHCVMAVRKELSKVDGLKIEEVQIGNARVQVDETRVTQDIVAKAIEEAGYRLVAVQ